MANRFVQWLLGWAILAWLTLSACSLLAPGSPRVERFNCQVRALEPLVGDVLDAEQLMRDLYAGRASFNAVLANIEATQAEAEALRSALQACEPPQPLPEDVNAS